MGSPEVSSSENTHTKRATFLSNLELPDIGIVILAAGLLVYKYCLVLSGTVDIGRSDDPDRILLALDHSNNWKAFLQVHFFASIWPPGEFVIIGAVYEAARNLSLEEITNPVELALLLSSTLFVVALFPLYRIGWLLHDKRAGLLIAIIFAGTIVANELSYGGWAETYTLNFFVLGILFYVKHLTHGTPIWISAAFFMLASMCQVPIVFCFPILCLYLMARKEFLNAFLFGLIASVYFVIDNVVVWTFFPGAVTYTNMTDGFYSWSETSLAERARECLEMFRKGFLFDYSPIAWSFGCLALPGLFFKKHARLLPLIILSYWSILLFLMFTARSPFAWRYLYPPNVAFVIVTGLGACSALDFLSHRALMRRAPLYAILVVVSLGITVTNLHTVQKQENLLGRRQKTPQDLTKAVRWLNANLKGAECLSMDFLYTWGLHVKAKTTDLNSRRNSCVYGDCPRVRAPELPENAPLDEIATARFHAHILQYRPRYVVLASEAMHNRLRQAPRRAFGNPMMRPSYFRPYMKPARDVNEFCRVIESQYVNATFTMCRVLENSMVEIYELESITSGGRVIFRRPGVKENALYGDAQPIESDNVLGDPGFETGTWQNLALSGNVSRSGETSGEFADKADVAMSEIVNLGDSTSITASLWAYSMIREGGRVKIALRYLDEDGRTISNNHPIADIRAPNEKWRQHTVSVSKNEFPPTATDVVIQIQRLKRPDAGEGGSVFIDDASLKVRLQ